MIGDQYIHITSFERCMDGPELFFAPGNKDARFLVLKFIETDADRTVIELFIDNLSVVVVEAGAEIASSLFAQEFSVFFVDVVTEMEEDGFICGWTDRHDCDIRSFAHVENVLYVFVMFD